MRTFFILPETSKSLTLQEWNITFYFVTGKSYTLFFLIFFLCQLSPLYTYRNYINPIQSVFHVLGMFTFFSFFSRDLRTTNLTAA